MVFCSSGSICHHSDQFDFFCFLYDVYPSCETIFVCLHAPSAIGLPEGIESSGLPYVHMCVLAYVRGPRLRFLSEVESLVLLIILMYLC